MTELDDKYYYKIKSIQAEAAYIAKHVKEHQDGMVGLIKNEGKRANVRKILASIQADLKAIQDTMGSTFIQEL